ncbi:MAG TPA: Ig-like domain-containing protein [Longimicrobium sp.]|jgi:alpha-tubulin suppressor-like RCC1 family protein|uniref:RCC1 domain-containing protein n=1 Tax=Longimicrobium sp. TaxID=2029185 RepID=UPI002EDAE90D
MAARRILLLAAALLAACGDSTGSSAPATVAIVSGSGQAGTVAQAVPNPLVVRVTTAGGDAVQGVAVQWAVSSGEGSLSAASTMTGADGLAQVQWTLGPRAEAQTVTATVQGLAPAVFTVTPAPGPFARVTLSPDSVEVGAVGLSVTLHATWMDAYGNSMERPGGVVWTSLDQAVARLETAATASQIHVVAVAGGRARIVVRTVNNRADTAVFWVRQHPASITVTLRDGATVTEGDTTRAFAVVRDAGGNPIPGAPVTWSTTDPAAATVDATGKVTVLRPGPLNVVAASGNVTGTATLQVSGMFRVASLVAGGHHSCALTAAGQAYCWGWNQAGQLGVPAPAAEADRWSDVPVAVQADVRFTAIAASAYPFPPRQATWAFEGHSCGIATDGALLCWGEHAQGQLGRQGTAATHVPAEVAGGRTWAAVSTGGRHTCGIATGGQAYCWGLDGGGQLGAAATELCPPGTGAGPDEPCARTPQRVLGGLAFTRISAGPAHTCGLTAGGAAYCWGRNGSGQLGNGTTTQADAPEAVLGGHAFVEISAGASHTCARTAAGAAYCWGANDEGQLGSETPGQATSPVAVMRSFTGAGDTYTAVEAGWSHSCGLLTGGRAFCWGSNQHGQTGRPFSQSAPVPVEVVGGFPFASISTAGFHTCAVRTADNVALCWGNDYKGKLGSGPLNFARPLPRPVRAP